MQVFTAAATPCPEEVVPRHEEWEAAASTQHPVEKPAAGGPWLLSWLQELGEWWGAAMSYLWASPHSPPPRLHDSSMSDNSLR